VQVFGGLGVAPALKEAAAQPTKRMSRVYGYDACPEPL